MLGPFGSILAHFHGVFRWIKEDLGKKFLIFFVDWGRLGVGFIKRQMTFYPNLP